MTTQADKVKFWTTGYNFWRASQGHAAPAEMGEPQSFEDSPCAGFYRKGIYEKVPNKRSKRVGWEPVAIWRDADGLHAMVGNTMADPLAIWTNVCGNPISEEWYRAVERGEGWPDDHKTEAPSAMVKRMAADIPDEPETPAERIARELAAEKVHLATYATIDSDEMSSKARSLQNRFLELRGEAKKEYDTLNAPLLKEQGRLREIWFPLRDAADAASTTLKAAMGAWEDTKRAAAKRAEEETRKRQEEAAREHEWKSAEPGAINKEPPPKVEPVKSNAPAPSTQIKGGAGRAAAVTLQVFVTAIDEEKVFAQFKGNPQLVALLTELAQKAIRAGIQVPGATTEERSVIK